MNLLFLKMILFNSFLWRYQCNGTITPVKRRDPDSFNFDGICPYCGDKAKDFISIVENKIKSNKLSSIDETINYLILHQSDEIANLETISTKTFYNYVHQGRTSIKPIDLPRMVRKKTKKNWKTIFLKEKRNFHCRKTRLYQWKRWIWSLGRWSGYWSQRWTKWSLSYFIRKKNSILLYDFYFFQIIKEGIYANQQASQVLWEQL